MYWGAKHIFRNNRTIGNNRGQTEHYRRFVMEGKGFPGPLALTRHQLLLGDDAFVVRYQQNKKPKNSVKSQKLAGDPSCRWMIIDAVIKIEMKRWLKPICQVHTQCWKSPNISAFIIWQWAEPCGNSNKISKVMMVSETLFFQYCAMGDLTAFFLLPGHCMFFCFSGLVRMLRY